MKETFEDYLQRLKDRRTEDSYKYTDDDFKNYIHYIFDCYEKDLSVYKCLEFMYFAEREIQPEQIWNEEKMEGVKKLIQKQKLIDIIKSDEELGLYEETLEEAAEKEYPTIHEQYQYDAFIEGAKWQQEQHNFLPGLIKQFDPKEGEINGEEWTAVQFLKWLELNKFKIIKNGK